MEHGDGPRDSSPPHPKLEEFKSLVAASGKCEPSGPQLKFIEKLGSIPKVSLRVEDTCRWALNLTESGLIVHFTGLCPSLKGVEDWVKPNWIPLVKQGLIIYFMGKGFFVFMFENGEGRSLIFSNGPYFMGPQGIYLNKWSPDFDPAQYVPTIVPVSVHLPDPPSIARARTCCNPLEML